MWSKSTSTVLVPLLVMLRIPEQKWKISVSCVPAWYPAAVREWYELWSLCFDPLAHLWDCVHTSVCLPLRPPPLPASVTPSHHSLHLMEEEDGGQPILWMSQTHCQIKIILGEELSPFWEDFLESSCSAFSSWTSAASRSSSWLSVSTATSSMVWSSSWSWWDPAAFCWSALTTSGNSKSQTIWSWHFWKYITAYSCYRLLYIYF